jgi:DNA-binding Lrp family transcriptional regulator
MDSTDVLIFCEMSFKYFDYSGKNRRPSSKGIGEKLGLDERTVRLRIRKMEREGFIQYYQTVPNLRLLGQPLAYLCNFQATDVTAKRRAIDMFCEADDIIDIADYLGESFGVTVSAASEEDARETMAKLAKEVGIPRFVSLPPRQFPSPMRSLDKLDWQLVKSLRYDALKATREVARETGSTHRMAEYAIGKLFESQALFTRAIINARDSKGIIFYSLNLSVDEGKQDRIKSDLRAALGERVWWTFDPPGRAAILFLFSSSIGRAEDDLLEALSHSGVIGGSLTIFKGWVEPKRPSWIDRRVEEKIRSQISPVSAN